METGRRYKSPWSETKDFFTVISTSFMFRLVFIPQVPSAGCYAHTAFGSQLSNPEFRKSLSFKWVASKSANICPRGGCYLYHPGQKTLLQRKRPFLSSKVPYCSNIFEKIVQNKSFCWQDMPKFKEPMKNCPSTCNSCFYIVLVSDEFSHEYTSLVTLIHLTDRGWYQL